MLYDILMGKEQPDSGTVKWGKTISVSYFPQNNNEYFLGCDLNLVEWLSQYSNDHFEEYLRGWLGRMLFSGEEALKKAKVLSGGERTRLAILKLLLEPVNLLILDEPTNHLDLKTKDVLKQALQDYDGTLIVVSHDRDFLDGLVTKVYEFGGKRVREHLSGIYEFLETKKMESLQELERKK
jgi:ATP-binding cassette subfamily F protein 3